MEKREMTISKLFLFLKVDTDKPSNHFNDGKCDETGRLWAGTRGPGLPDGSIELEKGSLFSFENPGKWLFIHSFPLGFARFTSRYS